MASTVSNGNDRLRKGNLRRRDYIPRIISSGDFWSLDPLCIAAEGEELVMLGAGSSMANALGLLLAVYYVFDIAYPAKASNVYFFCETLIGIEQGAKKRIAINKFISAL